MKTELLRLESIVKHGVGGVEAGAISLIYSYLLQKNQINFYSYIFINQIGDDLSELVINEGKKVYINIRYHADENYGLKSISERNVIRLDIIHKALLQLNQNDGRVRRETLNAIRTEILNNNFEFDIEYRKCFNKKNRNLVAKLLIHPKVDRFEFYISIEVAGSAKGKVLIYNGKPNDFYFEAILSNCVWEGNEIVISGKNKEVEININSETLHVRYINKTPYQKSPFFEMMRADISKSENAEAYEDWLHSLPPAKAAILREADN
jgi:hypothetical protein